MDKQEAFIIYLELKEAAEEIQVIEQTLKENCIDPIPTKNLFSSNFNKMMEDLASNIKKLHSYIIVENDIELMKEVSLIPKHPFFFYPFHCGRTLTDASELFSKIQAFLSEIRIEYEKLAKETNSNNSKHKEVIPNQKEEVKKDTSFRSLIQYEDKDKLLERLHFLIDPNPKKGSLIAAIIQKAYIDGHILELPNEATFRSEFKLDCTWEAVRKSFISTPYIKTSSSYIKMMQIKILD